MEPLLIVSLLLGFVVTLFFTPIWIKKSKQIGLVWEDMHKIGHPKNVAGSGGIGVLFGFLIGVLFYIAVKTFYFKSLTDDITIFALLTTILIVSVIGFIDDLFGWRRGGLSIKSRLLLLVLAAIPLMVINAGESMMLGIEFGIIYPLILIPFGVVGASATYNFLAGYNGLEAGQGIIILTGLAYVLFKTGSPTLALISLVMVACLIAFYLFNKLPARVFPGDVLTYAVGAMIAIDAILGNIEKIAVFFFIPYIIETILKSRGGLKKQSILKLNEDGSLDQPYPKWYGLGHIAVAVLKRIKKNGKAYERDIVYLINGFQILIILIGIFIVL